MKAPVRDYSALLDAYSELKVGRKVYKVVPLNEALEGDIGYYSLGNSVCAELVNTIYSAAGPDFSAAINALKFDLIKGVD